MLEVTIGFEQVAVDLTAWLARTEPDPYIKQALDFALLEDFDHLYRYANLMEFTEGKKAEAVVKNFTEIMPGRPTMLEHRHPFDSVRNHYGKNADPVTKMHVATITAGEQQTMNFYMNVGNRIENKTGRGLYAEIAQIEEQHVSHYESLADPTASWYEMLVLHEYNECYLYYSCMTTEVDDRIKKLWEHHLNDEIEHLRIARELMQKYEKREATELFGSELPELVVFQPNKEYVRDILKNQVDYTAFERQMLPLSRVPDKSRYEQYQQVVNKGGVPSQLVIEDNIRKNGRDYRIETEGPHPVEKYRAREKAAV